MKIFFFTLHNNLFSSLVHFASWFNFPSIVKPLVFKRKGEVVWTVSKIFIDAMFPTTCLCQANIHVNKNRQTKNLEWDYMKTPIIPKQFTKHVMSLRKAKKKKMVYSPFCSKLGLDVHAIHLLCLEYLWYLLTVCLQQWSICYSPMPSCGGERKTL